MRAVLDAVSSIEELRSDGRPSSLLECMLDGQLDANLYLSYLKKQNDLRDAEDALLFAFLEEERLANEDGQKEVKKKGRSTPRSCKNLRPFFVDDNGEIIFLKPVQTYWYLMYVKDPISVTSIPKFEKKFRRRFRLPHSEFLKLYEECKDSGHFDRWLKKDAVGSPASPLELLVLGALRYPGRGLTLVPFLLLISPADTTRVCSRQDDATETKQPWLTSRECQDIDVYCKDGEDCSITKQPDLCHII